MPKKEITVVDAVSDPKPPSEEDIRRAAEEGMRLSEEFAKRTAKMTQVTTVDSVSHELERFIRHTEARLHSIREYLKTVKLPGGYRLFGDEDLERAFGKSFLEGK